MKFFSYLRHFLASVQLAIFTLSTLAVSSVIGTIIAQGQSNAYYVKKFGFKLATFIQLLDIPHMYTSWWFLGLLGLLTINLIVCSIERFPLTWKNIHQDNMTLSQKRLEKMKISCQWKTKKPWEPDRIVTITEKSGWKGTVKTIDDTTSLFFAEKGKWSRLGVYCVHLSILVIFLGALTGYLAGFKASIMLAEGKNTTTVYSVDGQKPIDLGFSLHCNNFLIDYYDTGIPKEYRSNISIIEKGNVVLNQDIMVNSPLTYRGITFYQSSYQGYQDFLITITDNNTGEKKTFQTPFRKQVFWQNKGIRFGIVNVQGKGTQVFREKLWFKISDSQALQGWIENNTATTFSSGQQSFTVRVKQLYATGLRATRDPGVWLVYLGCLMMLIGLYLAVFMSHRRIWLHSTKSGDHTTVILAGTSNKNRQMMKKEITRLENLLQSIYSPISR